MKDIDDLLREDARADVADNGFTHRVMSALPRPLPARRSWLTPVLVLGSTAVGSVLAVALSPGGFSIAEGFVDLVQMRGFTPAAVTALALAAALSVSAILLAADAD